MQLVAHVGSQSMLQHCVCHADNIEALQGWCKTRFQGMEHQLESFFEEVSSPAFRGQVRLAPGGCWLIGCCGFAERNDKDDGLPDMRRWVRHLSFAPFVLFYSL